MSKNLHEKQFDKQSRDRSASEADQQPVVIQTWNVAAAEPRLRRGAPPEAPRHRSSTDAIATFVQA